MKVKCTDGSLTGIVRKNTSDFGGQTKTVTMTLMALPRWTWMMSVVVDLIQSLNHSKGPFKDPHLFKKDDLIMFQVRAGELVPYQINPVQILPSHDLIYFQPKSCLKIDCSDMKVKVT